MKTIEVFYGKDSFLDNSDELAASDVSGDASVGPEIVLRDYQLEAYQATIEALRHNRSALVVMATGLGKTVLFAKIIQNWSGRVLVLSHLEEILQNAIQEISAITGEKVGVERGLDKHEGERIICGLVQSVSRRLEKVAAKDFFSLIIVDEAHNSPDLYEKVFAYFSVSKVIGVTATDKRADGKDLPYDTISYRMGIREGVERSYLVPIIGEKVFIESIDLRRVKVSTTGDFNEEDLDSEIIKGASAIADTIIDKYGFDCGILFFPGCASAQLTSDFLNKRIPGISVYIDGKTKKPLRKELISRLRNKESAWLCNVGIATEGFNWPEASVIGMCAPTLSWTAYVQRAGRGTRPLQGLLSGLSSVAVRKQAIAASPKPNMKILDFVGVSSGLNLISAESFLENKNEHRSLSISDNGNERNADISIDSNINETVGLKIKSFREYVHQIESKTVTSIDEFDPFGLSDKDSSGVKLKGKVKIEKSTEPSEKQLATLKKFGIEIPGLSRNAVQEGIKYIAGQKWRIGEMQKVILRKVVTNYGKV